MTVINAVAVAHIEATLAAIPPDRVLDKPGKGLRKARIELPGIDPLGDGLNDVGAAAGPVAGRAIQVVRVEPGQNAGPVQKVVNQRSMAIMAPPTSIQRTIFLGAPSRRLDRAMARTLSETP